jgi:hypothetical protein
MNEAPSTTPEHVIRTPGALQAVLQHADGTMDSVAVALPLPEAIVRVDAGAGSAERWFTRERSSDSVLRYVELEPPRVLEAPRRCAQCVQGRSEYWVQKSASGTSDGAVLCPDCYTKTAGLSS